MQGSKRVLDFGEVIEAHANGLRPDSSPPPPPKPTIRRPSTCTQTANSTPRDDGEVCTTGDVCKSGKCTAGKSNKCDDSKPCTLDLCDPDSGACKHEPYEGPCSDGNAGTVGEVCSGGACKNGKAVACEDGNSCTDDSCDPKLGCSFVGNTLACDAGVCTTGDGCKDSVCVSSQQKVVWQAQLAGSKNTTVRGIAPASNGFFAVASYDSAGQPSGGALLRVDSQGKLLWKVEPGLGPGGSIAGVATIGGDAVVFGSNCTSGKCYRWFARYNAAGTELMQSTANVGTEFVGRHNAIVAVPGIGFALAGWQYSTTGVQNEGVISFLDNNLAYKWYAYVGGTGDDAITSIAVAGSDFVVGGWFSTTNAGHDGLVARISSAGTVKWQRTYGGVGKDEFNAVVALANGDIGLAGVTGSKGKGGNDGWFVRLVGIGELADDRAYGTAGADEFLAAVEASGGGMTFAGRTQGKGTATQGWLYSIDGWGNTAFSRTSGGAFGEDAFFGMAKYGGGLLAGGTQADASGLANAAFVRTDNWGHPSCSTAIGCLDMGGSDCDDGNECTLDGCDSGKCNHAAATIALPCDSTPGYCQGGACVPPPASCKALQSAAVGVRSGVFQLDPDGSTGPNPPFAAWCDQSRNGGGWTLVLKADTFSQNFIFASPQWLSPSPFGTGSPGYDTTEAKLASYASLPLKEVRVGLRTDGIVRSVSFDADGPSLLALMTTKVASSLGHTAWRNLVPTLYNDYNPAGAEGINPPELAGAKVRIGFRNSNGQAGGGNYAIGLSCYAQYNGLPNISPVGAAMGNLVVYAFGYVWAR